MDQEGAEDVDAIVDSLLEAELLEPADGDELRLTDEFVARVDRWNERIAGLDEAGRREELSAVADDATEEELTAFMEAAEPCEELLAEYLALGRADVDGLSHADRLRVLTVFAALRPSPPLDGVPEPFVAVDGHRLPFLVGIHERAIVYAWLHDCPPCDTMRETFEEVLSEPPDDIALYAVYGPDCSRLLQERYEVSGGPATVSFYRGEVDARMYGAQYGSVIEKEIENLRELDR